LLCAVARSCGASCAAFARACATISRAAVISETGGSVMAHAASGRKKNAIRFMFLLPFL
jgi:hypothetical protein